MDFARNETRFRMVEQQDPQRFKELMSLAQKNATDRFALYEHLATPVEHHEAPVAPRAPVAPNKEA